MIGGEIRFVTAFITRPGGHNAAISIRSRGFYDGYITEL
jgi:hypothetical protein